MKRMNADSEDLIRVIRAPSVFNFLNLQSSTDEQIPV